MQILSSIREQYIRSKEENMELHEILAQMRRENELLRQENAQLSNTIVSYVQHDISSMRTQIHKMNSSTTRIVEELD